MGEVGAVAQVLSHEGILKALQEHVQFARARFGHYDLIDFAVVLIGYTLSGAPTIKAFYEQLLPFAEVFMALFGRHHLPDRSTLSRFLAALDPPTLEALRTLFEQDLVKRTSPATSPGGLWDRLGNRWLVVDVDATKQAARQRALPQLKSHPSPHRRFEQVAAPGSSSTQKRRSGKDSDHHLTSLYSSMDRNMWSRTVKNFQNASPICLIPALQLSHTPFEVADLLLQEANRNIACILLPFCSQVRF